MRMVASLNRKVVSVSCSHNIPSLDLIPDIHSLLTHLAKANPLLWSESPTNSDTRALAPTYEVYLSWAIGMSHVTLHLWYSFQVQLPETAIKINDTAVYV